MNMKLVKTALLSGVVSLLFICGVSYAQPLNEDIQEKTNVNKEAKMNKTFKELGLTPDQQKQIKEQFDVNNAKAKEIREQIRTKREKLKQEMESDTVDRNKINKLVTEVGDLNSTQLRQRVESILLMKQVLTPDQYKRLESIHDARTKGIRGRPHFKRGDSHGPVDEKSADY
ncbi:MAG: hypothetical protein COS99_07720 [Candidatus Omnitrophica bacterium CG07_land_8_20_14_0_80_42_15]|uniref:Periplasmic heavy metal sensor n=1 Tax=Candidatus Aquitaenariimonas noxiae TaxID=1974741 RepID=A0A2J0L359_9BACT|nr:MAG: hypothetical protein COS99_07720 [Candidatus Omnitrophica bacterium CG07_land_8_20_14_0_80_42_15]